MPATANKFVHILWKNLICDNVAAVRFYALPERRGCWRRSVYGRCLYKGDASAGCRRGAQCAPAPSGAVEIPLTLSDKLGGNSKASLTLARAARPKGMGLIRKKGKTFGVPLLVRSAAAQAAKMQL